jgi:hypothetical protein
MTPSVSVAAMQEPCRGRSRGAPRRGATRSARRPRRGGRGGRRPAARGRPILLRGRGSRPGAAGPQRPRPKAPEGSTDGSGVGWQNRRARQRATSGAPPRVRAGVARTPSQGPGGYFRVVADRTGAPSGASRRPRLPDGPSARGQVDDVRRSPGRFATKVRLSSWRIFRTPVYGVANDRRYTIFWVRRRCCAAGANGHQHLSPRAEDATWRRQPAGPCRVPLTARRCAQRCSAKIPERDRRWPARGLPRHGP